MIMLLLSIQKKIGECQTGQSCQGQSSGWLAVWSMALWPEPLKPFKRRFVNVKLTNCVKDRVCECQTCQLFQGLRSDWLAVYSLAILPEPLKPFRRDWWMSNLPIVSKTEKRLYGIWLYYQSLIKPFRRECQTHQLCQGPGNEQTAGWMCHTPPKNTLNNWYHFCLYFCNNIFKAKQI